MKIEDIEIHVGEPQFPFEPVRQLEAKCEAITAFSSAPTMDQVNVKLREMAAGLGANAVVRVEYKSGASMTSWRSMRGTGLAVRKLSDDIRCPVCAEAVKRAALKCRFCGADIPETAREVTAAPNADASGVVLPQPEQMEPLRSTNNPMWVVVIVAIAAAMAVLYALTSR